MKFKFMRFMLNVLHTLNGFALGVFLIQKDYLIALGSLALFLILWINDNDSYWYEEPTYLNAKEKER